MPKTVTSPLQKKLAAILVERRKAAGLRQVDLAEKMGVYQSWVTHMESGQRRIDVVELIELGKIPEFDPVEVVRKLSRKKVLWNPFARTRRVSKTAQSSRLPIPDWSPGTQPGGFEAPKELPSETPKSARKDMFGFLDRSLSRADHTRTSEAPTSSLIRGRHFQSSSSLRAAAA